MSGDNHRAVDNEFRAYLTRLANVITKKEYENEEERAIIIKKVYVEVVGKELPLCLHQGASRLLETFLPEFNSHQVRTFAFHLDSKYMQLCFNCSGSHVLELLLSLLPKCIGKNDEEEEEEEEEEGVIKPVKGLKVKKLKKEDIPPAEEIILNICDQISTAWGDLLQDNYASHVVRRLFYTLSGVNAETQKVDETLMGVLPSSFKQYFVGIVGDFINQPEGSFNISELGFHPSASPTLQTVLDLLAEVDVKLLEKFANRLLKYETKEDPTYTAHVNKLLKHSIGSHLMEKILQRATPTLFMRLYNTFFRGKLFPLILDQAANFVVQQLIASAHSVAQAQLIFQELTARDDTFRKLFEKGRAGIVLKLAESYERQGISDGEKKKLCREIAHGLSPETGAQEGEGTKNKKKEKEKEKDKEKKKKVQDFDVKLLLELKGKPGRGRREAEQQNSNTPQFSFIGSQIIQSLFKYPANCITWLVKGFSKLDKDYFLHMATSPIGSRVIEAFLNENNAIPLKKKLAIIDALMGHYAELAHLKYGSHVVENCYKTANVAKKEKIAQELLAEENSLAQELYGKIVLLNCRIGQFKKKQQQWKEKMEGNEKKKRMFADILNEKEEPADAEKTKQVEHQKETTTQRKRARTKEALQHEREKVMEVLGFGKKRKRDEDEDEEVEETEALLKKTKTEEGEEKDSKNKTNKKAKKEEDTSIDFIMDILRATKSKEKKNKKKKEKDIQPKKKRQRVAKEDSEE